MTINIEIAKLTVSEEMTYEGVAVLKYDISAPQLHSRTQGVARTSEQLAAELRSYQEHCRTEMYKIAVQDYREAMQNGFPAHEYEADRVFTVTANESCVLSLYTDTYEYTGGAHGNTVRTSQSRLFPGGRRITLNSLFPGNVHYRAALLARINAMIAQNPEPYFEEYKKFTAESFNPESFYLTPDSLAIYYQQYDIAPYSSGIPVFEFTYESVGATPPGCGGPRQS